MAATLPRHLPALRHKTRTRRSWPRLQRPARSDQAQIRGKSGARHAMRSAAACAAHLARAETPPQCPSLGTRGAVAPRRRPRRRAAGTLPRAACLVSLRRRGATLSQERRGWQSSTGLLPARAHPACGRALTCGIFAACLPTRRLVQRELDIGGHTSNVLTPQVAQASAQRSRPGVHSQMNSQCAAIDGFYANKPAPQDSKRQEHTARNR